MVGLEAYQHNRGITEMQEHNDNVAKALKNNDNVRTRKVDEIAARLVEKLGNPAAHKYYCLIGWTLPQNVIENNLEQALNVKPTKRNPHPNKQRYFTWLCEQSLQEAV